MLRRHLGSMLLLSAAVFMASCAEQQPAIDQIETRVYTKSLFAGEWYYGQTVVDVPGSLTVSMVGNTNYSGLYRVRWEVQEDFLYARKAYEHVVGAKRTSPDTGEFMGAIVGAWPIESHFNIQKSYNPTTGEENNVLTENSQDCQWHDCEYMRVDFSVNKTLDYMFLDSDEDIGKEPLSFEEWDSTDPKWSPIFDERNGYIDFTSAMVIQPVKVKYYHWEFPLCWWKSNADCNPEILKIRNSFWKRDPNRDYEPRLHQGVKDEWFGFFVQDRIHWDQHYDLVHKNQQKVINRHNIFAKHHLAQPCASNADCDAASGSSCDTMVKFHIFDVATDTDKDGLPDEFEKVAGLDAENPDSDGDGMRDNRDDGNDNGVRDLNDFWKWDETNMEYRCTIPMRDRDPKPIPYYNSGFFPKSQVCDAYADQVQFDDEPGPCAAGDWVWAPKGQRHNWSVLHEISEDYNETFLEIFLKGAFELPHSDYQRWVDTHDISQLSEAGQAKMALLGDEANGYYAFTICPNNPVQEYDAWPCRFPHMSFTEAKQLMNEGRKFGIVDKDGNEVAPAPRHGDIRYSFVNYVKDHYDGMSLLGLGPSMTDPRTGENLAGIANVYVLNDWAATNVQEMVQLINGQISPREFIDGVNLENWLSKTNGNMSGTYSAASQNVSPAQVNSMYDAMKQSWHDRIPRAGSTATLDLMRTDSGRRLNSQQLRRKMLQRARENGMFDPARSGPGIGLIVGTPLEKKMIDSEVLMGSGINPALIPDMDLDNLSEEVMDQVSLARGGFLQRMADLDEFKYKLSNTRQMFFMSMIDDAMVGLAHRYKDMDAQQIWAKARHIIMRAVTTHEMGHTVGLHHNWSGSEDALNFPKEYWQLRTNNFQDRGLCDQGSGAGLCPFSVKPASNFMLGTDGAATAEGLKSLYEYSYTSVMDYAGRYTIDGNGLGSYDKAALMYGHVDKVEVYKDTGSVPKEAGNRNVFDEWFTSYGSPLMFPRPTYNPNSYHYTSFFVQMGEKIFDPENKELVDYRDVVEYCTERQPDGSEGAPVPCSDMPAGAESSDMGFFKKGDPNMLPRVPYLFCTWTRGDISDGCATRDYGVDQYEKMKELVDGWDTWYVTRAFPRSRYGYDDGDYIGRYFRRMYYKLKNFNDGYAMQQGLLYQYFDPDEIQRFYTDQVNGYGAYTVAINDAFNMALRTMSTPDIKQYELNERADGTMMYNEAEYRVDFRTDMSNGRHYETSYYDADYRSTCGLKWWECLHHVGFYKDKIMAMITLMRPEANFVGRDTSEDIRKYRISFFDNYKDQLIDYFGGILSEDYDAIAPFYDPAKAGITEVDAKGNVWNNGVAWRNYAVPSQDITKPAGGGAVEAATRFTLQIYVAVYAMMMLHENFDNEYAQRARMWKSGNGGSWDVTPTAMINGKTSYVDPFSGTIYEGASYKDGRGIAQKMIGHANKLLGRTVYCDPVGTGANKCDFTVNATGKAKAETALRLYTQLMDIQVQVSTMYNNWMGANWNWNPFNP